LAWRGDARQSIPARRQHRLEKKSPVPRAQLVWTRSRRQRSHDARVLVSGWKPVVRGPVGSLVIFFVTVFLFAVFFQAERRTTYGRVSI
jgi:hypothetical protein